MTRGAIITGDPLNRSHPLAQGLVSLWLGLPNLQGSRLFDYAGGNHGTLVNGPTWTPGPDGFGALSLDATDDYVDTSFTTAVTDSPGFAVSGWFRPLSVDGNWRAVATKIDSGGSNRQVFVGQNGGYSCPTNGLTLFTNAGGDGAVGTAALTAGRWYWYLASHLGTGAGGNALWVWSAGGGWEAGAAGTANPSVTGIDADSGVNPVRFGRYTAGSPFPLGGTLGPQAMWHRAIHTEAQAAAVADQFRRGFPDLLPRVSRRPMAYKAVAAGGNNGVVVLDWW